jgi:hypothetical protein
VLVPALGHGFRRRGEPWSPGAESSGIVPRPTVSARTCPGGSRAPSAAWWAATAPGIRGLVEREWTRLPEPRTTDQRFSTGSRDLRRRARVDARTPHAGIQPRPSQTSRRGGPHPGGRARANAWARTDACTDCLSPCSTGAGRTGPPRTRPAVSNQVRRAPRLLVLARNESMLRGAPGALAGNGKSVDDPGASRPARGGAPSSRRPGHGSHRLRRRLG